MRFVTSRSSQQKPAPGSSRSDQRTALRYLLVSLVLAWNQHTRELPSACCTDRSFTSATTSRCSRAATRTRGRNSMRPGRIGYAWIRPFPIRLRRTSRGLNMSVAGRMSSTSLLCEINTEDVDFHDGHPHVRFRDRQCPRRGRRVHLSKFWRFLRKIANTSMTRAARHRAMFAEPRTLAAGGGSRLRDR